jgi:hypothetical protein
MVVDFPAPFGPRNAKISPASTANDIIVNRGEMLERLYEMSDLDDGGCLTHGIDKNEVTILETRWENSFYLNSLQSLALRRYCAYRTQGFPRSKSPPQQPDHDGVLGRHLVGID